MSQKLKISDLHPHKDNSYFFDDIEGEAWQEFLDSIKTSGVIEPIVVTQNKVIVSGHQRVRACKILGIEEIDAEVRIIDSEDEILKQLIETNVRQRGVLPNTTKVGRCLIELERIYGIRNGSTSFQGNQYSGVVVSNNFKAPQKTQEDLASDFGITVQTLHNYKQLAEMIPEIQDLIETGIVTPTTARAIVKKLPEFQQKELAKQFAEKGEKVTGKQANEEIAKIKSELEDTKEENQTLRYANKDLGEERDYYKQMYEDEQEKEPVKVEVPPADYEKLKARVKELESSVKESKASKESESWERLTARHELETYIRNYKEFFDVITFIKDFIKEYE